MARTITLTDIGAGSVTKDGKTIRLRATDADGELYIALPAEGSSGVAELLIHLAHDAAAKSGDDTHGGFVVDSIEMEETDEDHVAMFRFWLGQTPFQFLFDEVALGELERLARAQLETIRKAREA
jgi:hypothetical protein